MAKYSIVVPFHNEEENVTVLYARLKQVMEQVGESFEMVLVDDGSKDRTYKLLEEIAAVDSRVLVVKLRRNFGQTSALAAGFDHLHRGAQHWPVARSGFHPSGSCGGRGWNVGGGLVHAGVLQAQRCECDSGADSERGHADGGAFVF